MYTFLNMEHVFQPPPKPSSWRKVLTTLLTLLGNRTTLLQGMCPFTNCTWWIRWTTKVLNNKRHQFFFRCSCRKIVGFVGFGESPKYCIVKSINFFPLFLSKLGGFGGFGGPDQKNLHLSLTYPLQFCLSDVLLLIVIIY